MVGPNNQQILDEVRNLRDQVIIIKTQQERLVSDVESEKGTRERVSVHNEGRFNGVILKIEQLEERLRKLENRMYGLITGFGLVITLIQLWKAL